MQEYFKSQDEQEYSAGNLNAKKEGQNRIYFISFLAKSILGGINLPGKYLFSDPMEASIDSITFLFNFLKSGRKKQLKFLNTKLQNTIMIYLFSKNNGPK